MSHLIASAAIALIAIAGVTLFWIYVGYGACVQTLARWFARPPRPAPMSELPRVTVLVMSFNEERAIAARLDNLLALDYPADRLELIVVDSASSDETRAIVERYRPRVQLVAQAERRGKAAAIHEGIEATSGEIVVCTDANTHFAPDVLRRTLPHFSDPEVAGVAAAMRQTAATSDTIAEGGAAYWAFEVAMRTAEAQLHSPISMSGEFTSFRRALIAGTRLEDWYPSGAADDFALSLHLIAGGHRLAYAPDAVVAEPAPTTYADFASQKIRTTTQAIVTARAYRRLLGRQGWYGRFILPSRRVLPLFSPFLILLMLAAEITLALANPCWPTLALVTAQLAFHAAGALGGTRLGRSSRVLRTIAFFHVLNFLALCAWRDFFRARNYSVWDKVQSTRQSPPIESTR